MAKSYSRKNNPQAQMALREHLREFRDRLIKSAIATVLGAVGGFFLYNPIMDAIQQPIRDIEAERHQQLVSINYAGVATSFDLMVQISLAVGFVLASPVWLYQLWRYITPALHRKERAYAVGFLVPAVLLFFLGIWIAWICMPAAVVTLTMFTPAGGSNVMDAKVYINFVVRLLLSFGLAFVVPVALVAVNMLGLIRGRTILKSWRWVVVVVALLAAMTAPGTDVLTMFYLMAPLLTLFFIAIGICIWNDRRRDKRLAKQSAGHEVTADQATSASDLESLGRDTIS